MTREVVPDIYKRRRIGALPFYAGGVFANIKIHQGEVKEVIPPSSPRSISKLFYEYTVLVSQHEMGTFAHKLYPNCLLINPLAGGGDRADWRLRASTKDVTDVEHTDGSRVLVACVEGSNNQAVIIGGLRDERSGKDPEVGQYFEWEYNGVHFQVNDDGSWQLVSKGKTDNLGQQHADADQDGIGTMITTEANGNLTLHTAKGTEIVLNNNNNDITIKGSDKVTIDAPKIELGSNASDPSVMGNELVGVLQDLCQAIAQINVIVAGSASSPPLNAPQFLSIIARLQQILSKHVYIT
jgi:hypothetical protein